MLDSLVNRGLVVIEFWATWCKPCIRELDTFKKLNKEVSPQDVTFVGINIDETRTRRNVPLMVKSRGWDFLILYDDDQKVAKLFQVQVIPCTFIIGKNREILYHCIGFRKGDEELLYKEIQSVIEKPEGLD